MRPSLWFVRNNADDYKNERMEDFLETMYAHWSTPSPLTLPSDDYDVVVLQEMFHLLNFRLDLVISGINGGPNLGENIFYSGTEPG